MPNRNTFDPSDKAVFYYPKHHYSIGLTKEEVENAPDEKMGAQGVRNKKGEYLYGSRNNENIVEPDIGTSGNIDYDMNRPGYVQSDGIVWKDHKTNWQVKTGKNLTSGYYEGDQLDEESPIIKGKTRGEVDKQFLKEDYDSIKPLVDMGEDAFVRNWLKERSPNPNANYENFSIDAPNLKPWQVKAIKNAKQRYAILKDKMYKNNKHLDYNKDGKLSRDEYASSATERDGVQRQVNRKLFDSDRSVYSRVNPETGEKEFFTRWSIGKLGGKERKISEKRAKFIKKKMKKRQDRVYGGE